MFCHSLPRATALKAVGPIAHLSSPVLLRATRSLPLTSQCRPLSISALLRERKGTPLGRIAVAKQPVKDHPVSSGSNYPAPRASPPPEPTEDGINAQAKRVATEASFTDAQLREAVAASPVEDQSDYFRKPYPTIRHLLLAIAIVGLGGAGAAALSASESSTLAALVQGGPEGSVFRRLSLAVGSSSQPDHKTLDRARRHRIAATLGQKYRSLLASISALPRDAQEVVSKSYLMVADWYVNLPSHQMAILPFIAFNTTVFLMWKIPSFRLQRFLQRNFVDTTGSHRFHTFVLSSFSHQGLGHFIFNQVALWSIGSASLDAMRFNEGRIQDLTDKFGLKNAISYLPEVNSTYKLGLFWVSTAIVSGLVSRRIRYAQGRMTRKHAFNPTIGEGVQGSLAQRLSLLLRLRAKSGSLGSSGVAYGLFAMSAFTLPDSKLALVFIPSDWFSLNMQQGVGLLVLFDVVCVLTRRFIFDHFAHLAGALSGLLWYLGGADAYETVRRTLSTTMEDKRLRGQAAAHEGNGWTSESSSSSQREIHASSNDWSRSGGRQV